MNRADALRLNPKIHILKQCVEHQIGEDIEKLKFYMRVIKYWKTAFEPRTYKIQEEEKTKHILFNSKNESNHCSIPHITINISENESRRETEAR